MLVIGNELVIYYLSVMNVGWLMETTSLTVRSTLSRSSWTTIHRHYARLNLVSSKSVLDVVPHMSRIYCPCEDCYPICGEMMNSQQSICNSCDQGKHRDYDDEEQERE